MEKIREKHSQEIDSIKPFQLVKYLSIASLSVILVSAFVLSGFIARGVKNIILKKSEDYAFLVTENLNHQVFYQFTLPTLIAEGEIKLSLKNQYERLDKVVKNTIHGFSVEKVNIYDVQERLTYSTSETEELGKEKNLGEAYKRALKGETVSVFKGGFSFLGFEWPWGSKFHKLVTYNPMWIERPMSWKRGQVIGVFEITQDISSDYEIILRFQWIVIASFTVFVSVILTALVIIARRAEKIIEKRALERMKLKEKLSRAEHLASLGEMIASVSHEIKNPLGIIHTTTQLLKKNLKEEKNQKLVNIILEESSRLNNIVTEFLDFARPKEPKFTTFNLANFLDDALRIIEGQCSEKHIEIRKLYNGSEGVLMQADEMLLHRALYNIFINAMQAMPEGGVLSVGFRRNGSFALIDISDTGCGIPEDIRDKIFRPFFTTKDKGTGLGLAVVYSVIESHKGEIGVDSTVGKGTTITLKLPIKD